MFHPYADLLGIRVEEKKPGHSKCSLDSADKLLNTNQVIHGGAIYSLADIGMGAALFPALAPGEICATIGITINYFRPISSGPMSCTTEVIHQGKSVARLESSIYNRGKLAAKASGSYAIFKPADKKS